MITLLVALSLLVSVGASAAQPAPAETVTPYTPSGAGLQREVFGFVQSRHLDHVLEHQNFDALTTIAYFAVDAGKNGRLRRTGTGGGQSGGWTGWQSAKMTKLINKAHASGTKVVLTVTAFAWDAKGREKMTQLLSREVSRDRLANEIAEAVHERGVDGVNLDFEPIVASQKSNYVKFVRAVRAALDAKQPGYQLTVCTTGYIGSYKVKALTKPDAADALFVMGYQYRSSGSATAGSSAPLSGPIYDVTDTVNTYLQRGVSPDKIILGVPYYGWVWPTVTQKKHAKTRPSGGVYGNSGAVIYSSAKQLAQQHGRRWDEKGEQSAWVKWQSRACATCPLTWRQLYYDDLKVLGRKYDLVNQRGLRGAGIWALGYEGTNQELSQLIIDRFGAN